MDSIQYFHFKRVSFNGRTIKTPSVLLAESYAQARKFRRSLCMLKVLASFTLWFVQVSIHCLWTLVNVFNNLYFAGKKCKVQENKNYFLRLFLLLQLKFNIICSFLVIVLQWRLLASVIRCLHAGVEFCVTPQKVRPFSFKHTNIHCTVGQLW